jgi:hypothetical protein
MQIPLASGVLFFLRSFLSGSRLGQGVCTVCRWELGGISHVWGTSLILCVFILVNVLPRGWYCKRNFFGLWRTSVVAWAPQRRMGGNYCFCVVGLKLGVLETNRLMVSVEGSETRCRMPIRLICCGLVWLLRCPPNRSYNLGRLGSNQKWRERKASSAPLMTIKCHSRHNLLVPHYNILSLIRNGLSMCSFLLTCRISSIIIFMLQL